MSKKYTKLKIVNEDQLVRKNSIHDNVFNNSVPKEIKTLFELLWILVITTGRCAVGEFDQTKMIVLVDYWQGRTLTLSKLKIQLLI